MFSRKTSWISASYHPLSFGVACFLYILHKLFPSLFALLLKFSPVIVCATLLLGILLSYGELNVPENKEDHNITDTSSFLKTELVANDVGAKNEERFNVKSHVGSRSAKRMTVRTSVLGERRLNAAGKSVEESLVNQTDATSIDSSSSIEEDNNEKNSIKDNKRLAEYLPQVDQDTIGGGENNSTFLDVDSDKTKLDRCDDSCLGAPWHHIDHKDASSSSDFESDEAESSDPSVAIAVPNAVPMLDELDPLVSKDDSDDGSAVFSQNQESDDGSLEEEAENQDDEDEEETQEEEKDDGDKVAVTWTADDQRNLMELGNSELERNRRLENLLAKRTARKLMEKNLIDLDDNKEAHGQPASINARRRNPFDLPYDDESIPGSAPSVLLPRRNPFDLPDDQADDEENSSHKEFVPAPQRIVRRHESFSIGASFFFNDFQERPASRFKPYFGVERNDPEEAIYAGLHRVLSGTSDSKLSSTSKSDTVSSVSDQEHEKDLLQENESPTGHNAQPIEQDSRTLEDVKAVDAEGEHSQMNINNDHAAHLSSSIVTEQTHFGEIEDDTSEESVLDSSSSYAARIEAIDEEYQWSSSVPSEAGKCSPTTRTGEEPAELEQTNAGSSKGSTASMKSIAADSDAVNMEAERVHGSHVVEPLYDSSPTATQRWHPALDEAFNIADKGGSPRTTNELSDGRTEESLTSADGILFVAPSSLAFVEQNETVSREISIIKEHDVIGDELSRVHRGLGDQVLPVLPEPEDRERMLDELSGAHQGVDDQVLPVLLEPEDRERMLDELSGAHQGFGDQVLPVLPEPEDRERMLDALSRVHQGFGDQALPILPESEDRERMLDELSRVHQGSDEEVLPVLPESEDRERMLDELSRVHQGSDEEVLPVLPESEDRERMLDELSRVHQGFGDPILPVLPEPEERQRVLHPSLSSVEIEPSEDS